MSDPQPVLALSRLEARNISFGYEPHSPILSNWSASFGPGEMVALTGRSGRGKSTALYILGLMLSPSVGTILVGGQNSTGLSDRERSRLRADAFGFVFQDAALDPSRTVLDNVTEAALYRGQPRGLIRHRAQQLLEQLGVELDPKRKPGQVSGGQAQRVALCRALVGRPHIVLADEPTGNLDPQSADVVVTTLQDHAQCGGIVIVVTHDPGVAERCQRSIAL